MKTFLFLDATKIQFKAKESYTLCLGNISRDFSNILDMYRYLMNEMFGFIKNIFIVLLTSLVNSLSHAKVYP